MNTIAEINKAKKLSALGYNLPISHLQKNQQVWWIPGAISPDEKIYCLGGELASGSPSFASPILQRHGVWIPRVSELLLWLKLKNFYCDIGLQDDGANIIAIHRQGDVYKAYGCDLKDALYNLIFKILKSNVSYDFIAASITLPDKLSDAIELKLLLNDSSEKTIHQVTNHLEQQSQALSLHIESIKWEPYLSRHEITELTFVFAKETPVDMIKTLLNNNWHDNSAESILRQLHQCKWKEIIILATWDSLDQDKGHEISLAIDWASINKIVFYHKADCQDEACGIPYNTCKNYTLTALELLSGMRLFLYLQYCDTQSHALDQLLVATEKIANSSEKKSELWQKWLNFVKNHSKNSLQKISAEDAFDIIKNYLISYAKTAKSKEILELAQQLTDKAEEKTENNIYWMRWLDSVHEIMTREAYVPSFLD